MRLASTVCILAAFLPAVPVRAQTTLPAGVGAVEFRANQAFNRGEYAIALPLLQKVATTIADQPERLAALQERIRVCQRNLAKATTAPALVASAVSDGPPNAAQRKPHAPPVPGQVLEMSIKELGNFEYDSEHGGNIPADVKRLTGAKLRLRGFMVPMDQADNIRQFALVPSLFACCFGQPPQIQHTIEVNCPAGKAVSYCPDTIVVEGTLNVEEKKDDGYIISIFQLSATSVKAAPAAEPAP